MRLEDGTARSKALVAVDISYHALDSGDFLSTMTLNRYLNVQLLMQSFSL